MFPAHIRQIPEGEPQIQTATEHCRNTAEYAGEALRGIGLYHTAYLAGLVHDAGKFKEEFRQYITDGIGAKGSVNHSFAGCRMILERYHKDKKSKLAAEIIAYAAGAHHGLFDLDGESERNGFLHRMETSGIGYGESQRNFLNECADEAKLDQLFDRAAEEINDAWGKIVPLCARDYSEATFHIHLLARLVLSAVIEGDRRDTAEFMTDLPILKQDNALNEDLLRQVEEKLDRFEKTSQINIARSNISDRCRAFAETAPGIYRLNVPTGAGKTLSSLRYALAHAQKHNKHRVIFTAPLLSILEQNAAVIRDYVGDDSLILEHHSNIIRATQNKETLDPAELAEERWDAPIIITTMVQLFHTIFLGKTSSIRRFRALADSVIVIDEVQTVPVRMLSMFHLAVTFLSGICGATVVLCSATQPSLTYAGHAIKGVRGEICPCNEALKKPFRRTELTDGGMLQLRQIPEFARDVLADASSLLIVCNKKSQAEELFREFRSEDGVSCYHLSASMCPQHRRDVLAEIRESLKRKKRKTLCVSTQVIEAGVDISFDRVIRLCAGMDSIVQAAGRCNRNGESASPAPVYILRCADEDLSRLSDIQRAKNATVQLLHKYKQNPDLFENDLSSDASIREYYDLLYQSIRSECDGFQDFQIKEKRAALYDLLSENRKYGRTEGFILRQAFALAGDLFRVLESDTEGVLVPYGEGKNLICELSALSGGISVEQLKDITERAKPYTVSLYDGNLPGNAVTEICGVKILLPDYYDGNTGYTNKPILHLMEVSGEKHAISQYCGV